MRNLTVKTEYDKIIELMTWLLNLNEEEQEKVTELIKEKGIRDFFMNLESFDFTQEVLSKLMDLRNIIQVFDSEIVDDDFDEEGDM